MVLRLCVRFCGSRIEILVFDGDSEERLKSRSSVFIKVDMIAEASMSKLLYQGQLVLSD